MSSQKPAKGHEAPADATEGHEHGHEHHDHEHGHEHHDHGHAHHDHPPLVELTDVSVEETKPWQRVVSITLPATAWQAARAEALGGVRRKVQLPGFRKGKVPKEIVETQFGRQIDMDALEWLLPRAWHEAMHKVDLEPVADPEFSDVAFGEGSDEFRFKATVEVRPEVKITGYKGIKVTWYREDAPAEGVDRTLEALRDSRAEYETVERPAADGDRLTVDFRQVEADGLPILGTEVKGHVFELGSPGVLSDFSDGVRGLAAGGEKVFPVAYPADFDQASLAGQTRHFQVNLQQVEEKKLPTLDDDFAAKLGNFENLDALKARVQANIDAEVGGRNKQRLETALVRSLLAVNEFEVPPAMITHYVEHLIADREKETGQALPEEERKQALEGLRPGAELGLKRWFLLDAMAEQEKVTVGDEDVEAHLKALAEAEGGDLETLRQSVKRAGAEGRIREDLKHRKVFDFLESQAKITEEAIPENQGGAGA